MWMTHLLGPPGFHHGSETRCQGSRGSMMSRADEGDADCSTTEKQLVLREKHLLGDEHSHCRTGILLRHETQTIPTDSKNLIPYHLLSPVNGCKEKCIANLSLELSFRATQFKERKYPCEISFLIMERGLKLFRKVLWHNPPKKDTQMKVALVQQTCLLTSGQHNCSFFYFTKNFG